MRPCHSTVPRICSTEGRVCVFHLRGCLPWKSYLRLTNMFSVRLLVNTASRVKPFKRLPAPLDCWRHRHCTVEMLPTLAQIIRAGTQAAYRPKIHWIRVDAPAREAGTQVSRKDHLKALPLSTFQWAGQGHWLHAIWLIWVPPSLK